MFKILGTVTGLDAEPGELRDSTEFPEGTDFARLVKLGAVRPTGLGGFKGTRDQVELLDQVEELTQKVGRLEEERNTHLHRAAEDGKAWQAERKKLEEANATLALDNETLGNELTKAREANVALTAQINTLTAEADEARRELAALAAKTLTGDGEAAEGEAGAATAPVEGEDPPPAIHHHKHKPRR